jgi:catechol 2,3-dioxygenase-like lactoylglutathione lyase family enzyme
LAEGIGVERTDFVSLATQDRDRSLKFYGETLGLRRNELAHEDWPEFETGNLTLAIVLPEQVGAEFQARKYPIAFRVSNVAEARKKLEDAGIEFRGDTLDTGVCHMAFFSDPDGNHLMLHRRYAAYSDGSNP